MKKIYQLILFLGSTAVAGAQSAGQDAHNTAQGPGGGSPLFTNDVIVAPSSLKQHGTSIAVAFNGWLYEAAGLETMDSDSSGGIIRMSKDNGFTWVNFASWLYPNVDYLSPEIEVVGTDTNNLFLFVASAWHDSVSYASDLWVDKYNARNGAFITEVYNDAMLYAIRDVDLASDYRYPAWTSSPYSVGLLYSHLSQFDSIMFVSSGDGGNTWGTPLTITRTSAYTDQVSLAYGIGGNWANGRYFAAWEERSSFSGTSIGKIKTAHCQTTFNGAWTSTFCLDSLDASMSGLVRRPRIACQYNSMATNDSLGLSTLVLFERAYGGDTADCDILGFYSKSQPLGNFWYRFDVINNPQQVLQPDVVYDPGYNNFLLTFYNRTTLEMPYVVHDFNMISPSAWVMITNNFCDQPSTVKDPFPRVAINPVVTQAAFSWTRQATATREQAMFDAEYMVTNVAAVPVADMQFSLYPNPAQLQSLLTFNLAAAEKVHIDVYDLDGRLVMNLVDQSMDAGPQQVYIPAAGLANGTYIISVTTNSARHNALLIIAN